METWQEHSHTFTWYDAAVGMAEARRLSGRAYLEGLRDGTIPEPPMAALMGLRLVDVDDGRVVFTGEPRAYHYNGIGIVHGGYAATLFDTAIGCAAVTKVPAGMLAVTLDLQIRYFKPLTAQSGIVRCEGTIMNVGRTTATAEGRLTDGSGRLCGHATSTLALVPAKPREVRSS
ncbi:MAG: PaaI family thioesterase [Candidatus Velthaea sp.]